MGYTLCQENDEGDLRIVACGSTGLTDAQKRYAMVELEVAAITYALEHSRFFCLGAKDIIVHTDHQVLEELQHKSYDQMDNKRLVRLFEQICHYDVKSKYIQGAKNELANALLRNPPDTAEVADIPNMFPYKGQVTRIEHIVRKTIILSRDLIEMVEVGSINPKYQVLINNNQ